MKLDNILAQRANKTIYREGNLTVKVFDSEYSSSDILNEALNLATVSETGFRVPHLEEVRKIDGNWAIVMEYIEGESLSQWIEREPKRQDELLERLVDIQLEISQHSAPRLRHLVDKMHGKINACGLSATVRYELHSRLDSLPRHKKLCHGDFTPGNVIITPAGEAYVIDWAHATQGNASADAARTYLRLSLSGHTARAEKYMQLFCHKSDTARQYVNKWLPIVAACQMARNIPSERALLHSWADVIGSD